MATRSANTAGWGGVDQMEVVIGQVAIDATLLFLIVGAIALIADRLVLSIRLTAARLTNSGASRRLVPRAFCQAARRRRMPP